jgi:hypothetical protein
LCIAISGLDKFKTKKGLSHDSPSSFYLAKVLIIDFFEAGKKIISEFTCVNEDIIFEAER